MPPAHDLKSKSVNANRPLIKSFPLREKPPLFWRGENKKRLFPAGCLGISLQAEKKKKGVLFLQRQEETKVRDRGMPVPRLGFSR